MKLEFSWFLIESFLFQLGMKDRLFAIGMVGEDIVHFCPHDDLFERVPRWDPHKKE